MLFSPRRNATNLVSRDKVFWSKVFSEDASAKMLDLPLTNGGLRILESLDVGEGLELRHQRPGEFIVAERAYPHQISITTYRAAILIDKNLTRKFLISP